MLLFLTSSGGGPASYTLTAEQGAYALTGQDAATIRARALVAVQGSYALTGQAAGTRASRRITAAQGSYVLSGQDAALRSGASTYQLTAAQGSIVLTGFAANLYVTTGDGDEIIPVIEIMYSEDGGATWSNPRIVEVGRDGERRKRVVVNRLGISGEDGRTWRFRMSANVVKGVMGAAVEVEKLRA